MTPQMRNLLILLGAIVIVLILVVLLFGGKSPFMRLMNIFLEETDESGVPVKKEKKKKGEPVQKNTSQPVVEMAELVRKRDDRLRIIESDGREQLIDAYYELEFITRKGQTVKIQCSEKAYGKIPFGQQGSLTYKRNMLVKFKYYEDTVFND